MKNDYIPEISGEWSIMFYNSATSPTTERLPGSLATLTRMMAHDGEELVPITVRAIDTVIEILTDYKATMELSKEGKE